MLSSNVLRRIPILAFFLSPGCLPEQSTGKQSHLTKKLSLSVAIETTLYTNFLNKVMPGSKMTDSLRDGKNMPSQANHRHKKRYNQ